LKEKNNNIPGNNRVRNLFPIGVKMVVSFALVLFTVLIIINGIYSGMVYRYLETTAEETNSTVNKIFAVEVEDRFNSVRKDVHLLLDFIRAAGRDSYAARQASSVFFERSFFIAAVSVPGYIDLVDDYFFLVNNANPLSVSSWVARETDRIERASHGEPVISNPSSELGIPLIAMFYPWQQNNREEAVIILFSPDRLAEIFGSGNNSFFMTNAEGDVLVHANSRMVMSGSNLSVHPLFTALLNANNPEIKMIYTENGVKYFGAGTKLSLGGMMVFNSSEYNLILDVASIISRRNIFIICSAVFISIILIWFLSKTITLPVRRLVQAVSRIEEGQFDVELIYRFPDEIGILTDRFSHMGKTLTEKYLSKEEKPRRKSRK